MTEPARPRRGRTPSLSREQVVTAALDVMAGEGLAAVSFRSVGSRLGVNPMALYSYIRGKDELLAAMYDQVSREAQLPLSDAPAQDQIVDYYVRARRMYERYSDLWALTRRADLPGLDVDTAERLCALLAGLGLTARQAAELQTTLLELTIGSALLWSSLRGAMTDDSLQTMRGLDAGTY
ncbi:MAG: TetR/AcrR family transcriptional regulator, partial [Mycobacteriales bacterium]